VYGNETSGSIRGVHFIGEKRNSQFQNKKKCAVWILLILWNILRKSETCKWNAVKDASVKFKTKFYLTH
jgi:hypothetical protein